LHLKTDFLALFTIELLSSLDILQKRPLFNLQVWNQVKIFEVAVVADFIVNKTQHQWFNKIFLQV